MPTEGGLRQRQIQSFEWSNRELLGRLGRLQQGTLKVITRGMAEIPQVDWVFYPSVRTAQKLAQLMAEIALDIEQAIPAAYVSQGKEGYLHNSHLAPSSNLYRADVLGKLPSGCTLLGLSLFKAQGDRLKKLGELKKLIFR